MCHVCSIIYTIWYVHNDNLSVSLAENNPVCAPYLSRYEVGGSLRRVGEGQLLPRDHHHLWARAWLVDMGGRHGSRGIAGRDTSRPTTRRQAGPVGVVGLNRREVRKIVGERWGWKLRLRGHRTNVDDSGKDKREVNRMKGKCWKINGVN